MVQRFAEEILKLNVQYIPHHPHHGKSVWVVETWVDLAKLDHKRRRCRSTSTVPDEWTTDAQHEDCRTVALVTAIRDLLETSVLKSFECDDLREQWEGVPIYAQEDEPEPT